MIAGKGFKVFIDGDELDPGSSQAIINHSPDGFSWGYGGSGPAQLALALLLHFSEDQKFSRENYQDFKREVIAQLPANAFTLEDEVVTNWIADQQAKKKEGDAKVS